MNTEAATGFLTGSALKWIALVTMTIDHIGYLLLPDLVILRIIGRITMPIFAWMIAEGCRYTRNRKKYLGLILAIAALCQIVYFISDRSLFMCILVTFSMSIGLIFLFDQTKRSQNDSFPVALLFYMAAILVICLLFPKLLHAYGFDVDYGIGGVFLPFLIYMGKNKNEKLLLCAVGLTFIALDIGGVQWWAYLSLILLWLYNGKRGRYSMKYFFYIYYPLHLVVIQGIAWLI